MHLGTNGRPTPKRQPARLAAAAVATVLGVLLLAMQPAAAHWPEVGGLSIRCQGPDLVLDWEAVSWNLVDADLGTHPSIAVEISVDDGPFTPIGSGAFTNANGRRFSGTTPISFAATVIFVKVTASDEPWDGTTETGGSRWKSIHNTIRSCDEPTGQPTPDEPTPIPSPTPEVAGVSETPTPVVDQPTPDDGEPTPAAEAPTPDVVTPTPEVETPTAEVAPVVVERPTPTVAPAVSAPTPTTESPKIVLPDLPTEEKPRLVLPPLPTPTGTEEVEPEVLGAAATRDELASTGANARLLFVAGLALVVSGAALVGNAARLRYRRS